MKYLPNKHAGKSGEQLEEGSLPLYKLNRNGQYEMIFPRAKKSKYRWLLPLLGIGTVVLVLFTSTGESQEVQRVQSVMNKGLLCDTQDQVREFLVAVGQAPSASPPVILGCGRLGMEVPVLWEPIEAYEDGFATAVIIRAESPAFGIQFMYLDYAVKDRGVEA